MASESTQCSDRYLLEASNTSDNFDKTSLNKQVLYVVDSNNGSYSNGQVVQDSTNQLSSLNGFSSPKETYSTIPYVVSIKTGGVVLPNLPNSMSVTLKGNVGNILDRVDVQINGKSVVSGQNFSNLWNNQRLLYDTASSYAQKMAGTNLLYPDDSFPTWSGSYVSSTGIFTPAASVNGDGYSNNQIYNIQAITAPFATSKAISSLNKGAFNRALSAINTVTPADTLNLGWPSQTNQKVQTNMTQNGKSYFIPGSTAINTIAGTWIFFIKLQLIDIHPIFSELDLVKNLQLRLTYYFNVGSVDIATTATTMALASAPTLNGGNSCPVMITSAASNNPNNGVFAAASSINLAWGVVNNAHQNGGTNLPYQQTRLYIPFYTLTPEHERQIISNPIKKIVYNDVFIQQFINAASTNGQSFTLAVQSTIPNIQYINLLPYVSNTIPKGTTPSTLTCNFLNVSGVNQFASPFDSAPLTTAPGSGLYNLQCIIGSQPLYSQPIQYDWSMFLDEINNIFSVNGGNVRSIGNGLIDEIKWSNFYKSWIMDCSRISTDLRSNVTITGNLQSDQPLDFYVNIVYRRSFNLNRITCELTDMMN